MAVKPIRTHAIIIISDNIGLYLANGVDFMNISNFYRVYLPYCLQKQPNGGYAVLNREYKPVGFASDKYIVYGEFPVVSKIEITPEMAKKLSFTGSDDVSMVYLYGNGMDSDPKDSVKNRVAYFEKLALLAELDVLF